MTSLDEIAYEAVRPAYEPGCVSARFIPKSEITISWVRSRTEIEFMVSDYLDGAPEEVIGDLIRWTHRRISGDDDAVPGERAAEYLLSEDFRAKALPVWLERHGAWITGEEESTGITIGFYPGETMKCAALLNAVLFPEDWIRAGEITADTYSGELESGARIKADRIDGIATVTWTVDGIEVSQDIALNEGDFARIASGADPVAEGWEDGSGWRPVCLGNASGDVPRGLWDEAIETAEWESPRENGRGDEAIQDGTWGRFHIRAVYRVPDPEARTLVSLSITGVEE